MHRHTIFWLVVIASVFLLIFVTKETYLDQQQGAALVCYWAPQSPTIAVPIPRDPFSASSNDGPKFSDFNIPSKTFEPPRPRESSVVRKQIPSTLPPLTMAPLSPLGSMLITPSPSGTLTNPPLK